jgi:hypothetical protein
MAFAIVDQYKPCKFFMRAFVASDNGDYRRQADFEVKADMTFHYVAFDVAFGGKADMSLCAAHVRF